ncbi:hypothetical protein FB45DRAFT_33353 [Roridomyces roridus]|uniref:Uncharacterized protein n=1 Tax=Roridomyces roridus TaxID=1738132 RepID=A0AAD7CL22_9AGAR|nr:hypothetical protein FB45DRAFT_33353 [Roridomyces roridus]
MREVLRTGYMHLRPVSPSPTRQAAASRDPSPPSRARLYWLASPPYSSTSPSPPRSTFFDSRPERESFDDTPLKQRHTTALLGYALLPQIFRKMRRSTGSVSRHRQCISSQAVLGGVVSIFAVFPIYWGSVWSFPHDTLPGWIVDFDGGAVGQAVPEALSKSMAQGMIQ